jgi:hypothetical protein
VGRDGDQLVFRANATARARFLARRSGRYRVQLDLRGTPCHGGWPVVKLQLDGKPFGELEVKTQALSTYELDVEVPAGQHLLLVSFTNAEEDPPEARVLWLKGGVLELGGSKLY